MNAGHSQQPIFVKAAPHSNHSTAQAAQAAGLTGWEMINQSKLGDQLYEY
jgi:hypothetical protein